MQLFQAWKFLEVLSGNFKIAMESGPFDGENDDLPTKNAHVPFREMVIQQRVD